MRAVDAAIETGANLQEALKAVQQGAESQVTLTLATKQVGNPEAKKECFQAAPKVVRRVPDY